MEKEWFVVDGDYNDVAAAVDGTGEKVERGTSCRYIVANQVIGKWQCLPLPISKFLCYTTVASNLVHIVANRWTGANSPLTHTQHLNTQDPWTDIDALSHVRK